MASNYEVLSRLANTFFQSSLTLINYIEGAIENPSFPKMSNKTTASRLVRDRVPVKLTGSNNLLFENIDLSQILPGYSIPSSLQSHLPFGSKPVGSFYVEYVKQAKRLFVSISKDTLVTICDYYIGQNIEGTRFVEDVGGEENYKQIVFVIFMTYYHLHITFFNAIYQEVYQNAFKRKYVSTIHTTSRHIYKSCGINILRTLGYVSGKGRNTQFLNKTEPRYTKYAGLNNVFPLIETIYNREKSRRKGADLLKLWFSFIGEFPPLRAFIKYNNGNGELDIKMKECIAECSPEKSVEYAPVCSNPFPGTDYGVIQLIMEDVFGLLSSCLFEAYRQMVTYVNPDSILKHWEVDLAMTIRFNEEYGENSLDIKKGSSQLIDEFVSMIKSIPVGEQSPEDIMNYYKEIILNMKLSYKDKINISQITTTINAKLKYLCNSREGGEYLDVLFRILKDMWKEDPRYNYVTRRLGECYNDVKNKIEEIEKNRNYNANS